MKKVSVCMLLNNDYWGTIYSLERSGFAIVEKKGDWVVKGAPKEYMKVIDNVEVELLVAYTKNSDLALVEHFKELATHLIEIESVKNGVYGINDAKAYNQLFKLAQHEYVCVLKPYIFPQQHWLIELIHYYEDVDKSGIIGVCPNFANVQYAPLPSKELDRFVTLFLPNDNVVNPNGILFFLKEYLYLIGALDENTLLVGGTEFIQLQKRFSAMGYNNFYIPTQSCLIINQHKYTDYIGYQASTENLENTLSEMKKVKNYYIPL
jgi:hypothetical protein